MTTAAAENGQQQETGGAGGNASLGGDQRTGQAIGTASRAPLFQQQPAQQDAAANGTAPAQAPKGRGPVSTAGIPDGALKARLDRAKAQGAEPFLKALGAKDEAEARRKLADLEKAGQEAEKRRLAELSDVERMRTELETERKMRLNLEQRLATFETEREYEQHEQSVARIAGEIVDADALPLFKLHLAQHVKKLAQSNPALAEKFNDRGIRRFAEKWAKNHPKFAKTVQQQEAAPPAQRPAAGARPVSPGARPGAPAPVRRPVTTGVPSRKNPAQPVGSGASATMGNKTARPGRPNSMSPREVQAYAAQHGIDYKPILSPPSSRIDPTGHSLPRR